jgi:hypothetical protein
LGRGREGLASHGDRRIAPEIFDGAVAAGATAMKVAEGIAISLRTLQRRRCQIALHPACVGGAAGGDCGD